MKTSTATRPAPKGSRVPRDDNVFRLLIMTVGVFILMGAIRPDMFLTADNLSSMAYQFPQLGLLSIAIMLTMLTGGIDLSVVGIANLSGVLAALTLVRFVPSDAGGWHVLVMSVVAVAISLLTGALCGLFNGFVITKFGIAPILATLGTMQIFTGIAIVITRGSAVFGLPTQFVAFGNSTLWIIPLPLLVFAAVALATAVLLNRSAFGQHVYLTGANPLAAHYSAVRTEGVLRTTYTISGTLAAMAGLLVIAQTNSAKADYGTSYTLQAILVAVLGGVNPYGGFGKVSGVVLAILTLQFLSSGFNMLRFSTFLKDFVWGAVLILVMAINYIGEQRRIKRAIAMQEEQASRGLPS